MNNILAYSFNDVTIKPQYSDITSRTEVDLMTDMGAFCLQTPVISANMKTITGPKMAATMFANGGLGILHRFCTIGKAVEDLAEFYNTWKSIGDPAKPCMCGVSIGVEDVDRIRFRSLYAAGARIFCIDVLHAYHKLTENMIKFIRANTPSNDPVYLIVGNIATGEAAVYLSDLGVDAVKIGFGSGSVCETRKKTGVGVPQLYALEIVDEALERINSKVKRISDGGIVHVGDIAKSLKFADAVMVGSIIAGTSETPGGVYRNSENQFYKVYSGSASAESKGEDRFVEGTTKTVPFRGKVKYILKDIRDGLQMAFADIGARNFKEFQQKCEFIHITENASRESKFI